MTTDGQAEANAGRYELKRTLGTGGAGTVYSAWDRKLNRNVAFKRINPNDTALVKLSEEDAWAEAFVLASLQHPNIVTLYDFGIDEEGPFMVTELLEGSTIEHAVPDGGIDLKEFGDAVAQLFEALIAAHQAGLVHQDIKPANVMVTLLPSGTHQYKLLDFGLAQIMRKTSVGNTGTVYGSVRYISPEQLQRRPVDSRSDLYSLGCVFYFMLTGLHPFDGATVKEIAQKHITHTFEPLATYRNDMPDALRYWVENLFALHPTNRPASATEALISFKELIKLIETAQVLETASKTMPTLVAGARSKKRLPWGWLSAGLASAGLAVGSLIYSLSVPASNTPSGPPNNLRAATNAPTGPTTNHRAGTSRDRSVSSPQSAASGVLSAFDVSRARQMVGRQGTVEGVVHSIGSNPRETVVFINFADRSTDALYAVLFVSPGQAGNVKAALTSLVGRTVRASGEIAEYQGRLQLKIADATAIQAIEGP
jgi:serine/threonine protein kinase